MPSAALTPRSELRRFAVQQPIDAAYEIARLQEHLAELWKALDGVRPITPHVAGCEQPDDPSCARCVLDSELARLAEAFNG